MSVVCREESLLAGESLSATAPLARGWIIVEVPGPWGRRAVAESRLEVGAALLEAAEGTGTTVLVARRPGRAEDPQPAARRVWVAHTSPGGVRMRVAHITDDRELLRLDPAGIAEGHSPGIGVRSLAPTLFVCANGKRDACCAREGGALGRRLAESVRRDQVWECSHLGGHRFAATALLLPWGLVYGRLDLDTALDCLHAADRGEVVPGNYRGRSALPRWLQAAEAAVRSGEDIRDIDSLDVLRVAGGVAVPERPGSSAPPGPLETEVRCSDGRAWRVVVEPVAWDQPRAESCTGDPVSGHAWVGTTIRRAPDWPD